MEITAEETLGKHTGMTFDEDTHLIQTHFEYVIKAMEEYAKQVTAEKQITLDRCIETSNELYANKEKYEAQFRIQELKIRALERDLKKCLTFRVI
jgi:hypothetical protein